MSNSGGESREFVVLLLSKYLVVCMWCWVPLFDRVCARK